VAERAVAERAAAERAATAEHAATAERAAAAEQYSRQLLAEARGAASETVVVSPDVAAWNAVAEAEHRRAERHADPQCWRAAVDAWDRLDRPYTAAYCRWRLAEALLSSGSPAADAVEPARAAYRVASELGALPLRRELELLARRARLDLAGPAPVASPDPYGALPLSPREREVLHLLAHGYTNRQIATHLTISAKTASVHVSHILDKLGVSRRIEAAAIAQRLQR
jgi:DNA-binding NarL/FixJ family response regulator